MSPGNMERNVTELKRFMAGLNLELRETIWSYSLNDDLYLNEYM